MKIIDQHNIESDTVSELHTVRSTILSYLRTVQDTNSIRIVQSTRPHSSRPSSAFIARSVLRTRSHLADYDSVRESSQSENRHLHDTQNTSRFGERSATASSRRSSGNILPINIYYVYLNVFCNRKT